MKYFRCTYTRMITEKSEIKNQITKLKKADGNPVKKAKCIRTLDDDDDLPRS